MPPEWPRSWFQALADCSMALSILCLKREDLTVGVRSSLCRGANRRVSKINS